MYMNGYSVTNYLWMFIKPIIWFSSPRNKLIGDVDVKIHDVHGTEGLFY